MIQAGDAEALRELVERNLRFVVQVANKYKGYGLPLADLINEGNLGLLHAASKFDPEHGTRFITYAVWWIRQAIMHALAEGRGRCGYRSNRPRRWRGCGRSSRSCDAPSGTEPTAEEVARTLEMQPPEVEDLLRVYRPQVSLDAPVRDESDITRLDALRSQSLPSSEEVYFQASMINEVHSLLHLLEPREATYPAGAVWLDGPPKSLAAIGRELGLSRERVRQLESRARNKLRAPRQRKGAQSLPELRWYAHCGAELLLTGSFPQLVTGP